MTTLFSIYNSNPEKIKMVHQLPDNQRSPETKFLVTKAVQSAKLGKEKTTVFNLVKAHTRTYYGAHSTSLL